MQTIEIQDFVIRESSVLCPSCLTPFATPLLEKMPDITPETTVEADLHRVLPDAAIRGALIAICPACIFTSWSSAFGMHFFVPELLVPAPQIEYPKKFAHAVLTGRKNGAHPLDRAMLALNGCWCARETYIGATQEQLAGYQAENERWLTLASQEMETALNDTSWNGNRQIFVSARRDTAPTRRFPRRCALFRYGQPRLSLACGARPPPTYPGCRRKSGADSIATTFGGTDISTQASDYADAAGAKPKYTCQTRSNL